jgi:hypothetical protein
MAKTRTSFPCVHQWEGGTVAWRYDAYHPYATRHEFRRRAAFAADRLLIMKMDDFLDSLVDEDLLEREDC